MSDQMLGSLPSQRPEHPLHDRMLPRPELLGAFLAQAPVARQSGREVRDNLDENLVSRRA
jgi:hypothetical protein